MTKRNEQFSELNCSNSNSYIKNILSSKNTTSTLTKCKNEHRIKCENINTLIVIITKYSKCHCVLVNKN